MKRIPALLIILLSSFLVHAQEEKTVFSDLSKAKAHASANNQHILMVFAGSDWCRPCIQFKKEILQSEPFEKYAQQQLVILYLDFPAKKKNKLPEGQTRHNEALAERYNKAGAFPKILLLNGQEQLVGELKFSNQTPQDFIDQCQKLLSQ